MPVQAQIDDGLVAEWHFDEGIGNVLKDSSGNGNDGTIYGATWVDGKFGKALTFDGLDDYIGNIGTASSFSFVENTGIFSIEGYFKSYTPNSNQQTLVANTGTTVEKGFYFGWESNELRLLILKAIPSNPMIDSFSPATIITDTNWHYLGVTGDGTKIRFFVDGIEYLGSESMGEKSSGSSTRSLEIGRFTYNKGSLAYFNGLIDEVRIYNRALTAEEIKEHYESGPTSLSLTKTASPQSIKQNQTTTITLTVKNTGAAEIKDIEIADTVPSDLIYIGGEISKKLVSLQPKDSRDIIYYIRSKDAGTFNLNPATATYADDKGNYHTIKSKSASIEVIASILENPVPTSKPADGNVQSASVNLHGEKTDVVLGENVLLKLSAINIIGNPVMHVQVIIIPPNGWSVTSSEFSKSGAGQYTTMYDLKPEDGSRDIEVKIMPNQIGDNFEVKGRIIYYFGDDLSTREDHTLNLPIKVRAVVNTQAPTPHPTTPGFGSVIAFSSVILVWYLRIRKWK
jgi:uncharacterized repeat protein (TIGR01451 family)